MGSPKPIFDDELPQSETEDAVPLAPVSPSIVSGSGKTSNSSAASPFEESSTAASLDAALSSLTLCDPEADRMFRALATIFEASQLHDARIAFNLQPGDDVWTLLQRADSYEEQGLKDIPSLAAVKNVMEQMLLLHSQFLLPALRIVADKSREGLFQTPFRSRLQKLILSLASWRIPFGQSGLMDFGSSILSAEDTSDDLKVQALRLIGNSCADTGRSSSRLPWDTANHAQTKTDREFFSMEISSLLSNSLKTKT